MIDKLYRFFWVLGKQSGCHQIPERSFFYKGKQFPVCARCSGGFCGYLSGTILYLYVRMPLWLCLLLCFLMFLDWYVQFLKLLPSNNIRRFITGLLCGCGLMQINLTVIIWVIQLMIR